MVGSISEAEFNSLVTSDGQVFTLKNGLIIRASYAKSVYGLYQVLQYLQKQANATGRAVPVAFQVHDAATFYKAMLAPSSMKPIKIPRKELFELSVYAHGRDGVPLPLYEVLGYTMDNYLRKLNNLVNGQQKKK
jgi:hypothetical protein